MVENYNKKDYWNYHINVNNYTYVLTGINGAGPIRQNPAATSIPPKAVAILGFSRLSQIHPQAGAVIAYVPPFITNIRPRTTGEGLNWRMCGSKVACRNPMDIDVTIILDAATNTPGMRRAFKTDAKKKSI